MSVFEKELMVLIRPIQIAELDNIIYQYYNLLPFARYLLNEFLATNYEIRLNKPLGYIQFFVYISFHYLFCIMKVMDYLILNTMDEKEI